MEKETRIKRKKKWVKPRLIRYGDMAALTQVRKLKELGFGDDFASNISTVGG